LSIYVDIRKIPVPFFKVPSPKIRAIMAHGDRHMDGPTPYEVALRIMPRLKSTASRFRLREYLLPRVRR
jgi:hypothetical protein